MAASTTTAMVANATTTTTTTTEVFSTTTVTTTTTAFADLPGTLLNLHEICVADWDKTYDGSRLTPRGYTSWNALHIGRVTLSTWIILSHIAVILIVLGKDMLRVNPKNPLIANLALANILLGVFVVPVKQHFILNPDTVNCGLEMGWTFITDYFQSSVSLFAVLSLVMERFVFVYTQKKQKKLLRVALILGTILLIAMPWIASLLVLLPTYMGAFKYESDLPNTCMFKVDEDYFLAAQVLSLALPLIGIFILAPYTGLLDCLRPSHCIYEQVTPKGESMSVTALISFVSIFSEVPYCAVRILMMRMECNNPYCTRFNQALNVAIWVRICKAAIFPFIWLLYTDIRKAILCHFPKNRNDDNDDYEHVDAGLALVDTSRDDEEVCAKELYPTTPATPATTSTANVEPVTYYNNMPT